MPTLSIQDDRNYILCELNKYRCCNRLCDVIIVVKGREFPAHRAVLAAGGGFFGGLFAANMKEQSANKVELFFEVDPDIMDDVLGYLYTGGIELSQDNAQQVIMAADFLLLDKLKAHADKFLAQFVQDNPTSDLPLVYHFAIRYKCEMYEKAALKSLQDNFEAVINESSDILELSAEELQDIISADDLVVSSEEVVFRFVIDWVKHKEGRKHLLYKMFSSIRLHSLSEEFIQSGVTSEELVSSDTDCSSLVNQRMTSIYSPSILDTQHPRICLDSYVNAIFFINQICIVSWCFVPSQNSYYKFAVLDTIGIHCPKLLYHRDSVFMFADGQYDIIGFMFNFETNTWSQIASVDCDAVLWGVTYLKDIIYIAGGRVFPNENNAYKTLSNDVFACDVSHLPRTAPCSVQRVAPFNTARDNMHLVSDDNYAYAIGGSLDSNDNTEVVERYDPVLDLWEYMSPMKCATSSFFSQCSVSNGKIFVIQNIDQYVDSNVNQVYDFDQVYDVEMDTWLNIPRAPVNSNPSISILASCGSMLYQHLYKHGEVQIKSFTFHEQKQKWSEVTLSRAFKTVKEAHHDMILHTCPSAIVVRVKKDLLSTYEALNEV